MGETFQGDKLLVRGRLPGDEMAVVSIPFETPDDKVDTVARPLLFAKFAAGEWCLVNDGADFVNGVLRSPPREPIHVDAAG